MSAKSNQTLTTAQDALEYLMDLLSKTRDCRIENDFHFAYERALNEMMLHVMRASPALERSTCAECAGECEDHIGMYTVGRAHPFPLGLLLHFVPRAFW